MLIRKVSLGVAGGVGVVAVFFFGTLFLLDHFEGKPLTGSDRDSLRAEHAKLIRNALAKYRNDHGGFPVFPDNPVDVLKAALVDGGYLRAIPGDPSGPSKQYRYISHGAGYGLFFQLEVANGKNLTGGACLTGVGTAGKDWYGVPPNCPF